METIHVNASKPYDVILSAGVLSEAGKLIRTELEQRRGTAGMLRCRRVCVVTDETVGALYGGPSQALHTSLRNAGFETTSFVFPGGESPPGARIRLLYNTAVPERKRAAGQKAAAPKSRPRAKQTDSPLELSVCIIDVYRFAVCSYKISMAFALSSFSRATCSAAGSS